MNKKRCAEQDTPRKEEPLEKTEEPHLCSFTNIEGGDVTTRRMEKSGKMGCEFSWLMCKRRYLQVLPEKLIGN